MKIDALLSQTKTLIRAGNFFEAEKIVLIILQKFPKNKIALQVLSDIEHIKQNK